MSQWQDISTAPKDGRSILAYDAGYGRTAGELAVVIVSWLGTDEDYPWLESSGMQAFAPGVLTHWMPLPPAPEASQ
jgi:hypothetical protein